MTGEREPHVDGPRPGQIAFALGFVAVSVLLLALIFDQTTWVERAGLAAQPRFWPAVGLGTMVLAGALHLWRLPWRHSTPDDRAELRRWVAVLEHVGWFMGYALLVPVIGYLPATCLFVPLLCWRLGYRRPAIFLAAILFAVAVVVLFKGLLSVRIPGGALYDLLPAGLRRVFIQYL